MRNAKKRPRKDVLTILVNPDQGEALTLASNEGKIDVLLRNTNDVGSIDTQGVTSQELTATEDEEPEAPKAKGKTRGRSRSARNRFRRSAQPRKNAGGNRRGSSSTTTIEF
jgi:Flp pilus assembly protein CpaB